ncbi:MAG: Tat pathway signal protein [Alphaproteobacteria bacterium]|nr:MAG: Tat pathway signal protein [Alphaproteobacteria bacterium]PZO35232.1 MAG: Tat pathway signal protein [Alphaproteobacteria bacterium]
MDRRALFALAPAALGLIATSARAGGPSGGGGGASANTYLRYPTITATSAQPGGRRGIMTVETGVDVPDEALRLRAEQSAPRLRAAYAVVVQRNASQLLPGAPPNVDQLSRELQVVTDRVLGRTGAKLLLGTVMMV